MGCRVPGSRAKGLAVPSSEERGKGGASAELWEASLSHPHAHAAQVRGSRLYIFQTSPADAGEYVCRASNGVEASITVTVTGTQGANFAYRE